MISVERWTRNRLPNIHALDAINKLRRLYEPNANTWTLKEFERVRGDHDVEFIIITDASSNTDSIIGIATLYIHWDIIYGTIAEVRNIIIDDEYSGDREMIEDKLNTVIGQIAYERGASRIMRMNDKEWGEAHRFFISKEWEPVTLQCYGRPVV